MASLFGGEGFLCGISSNNSRAFCWDSLNVGMNLVPKAFKDNSYLQIAAGKTHLWVDKESGVIFCWGPKSGNLGIFNVSSESEVLASGKSSVCGISRMTGELNVGVIQSSPDYSPPLELCSPGVCSPRSCARGKFAFNASILNEPGLTMPMQIEYALLAHFARTALVGTSVEFLHLRLGNRSN
ncbi:hypothetical protein REPUB_Repub03eG0189000 [Reevesia pubescens]